MRRAHTDATSFDVRYRIRPSIKALLAENIQGQGSVYRRKRGHGRDRTGRHEDAAPLRGRPIRPATLYTDGIAHGVACPPAPQVVTVTATGHVLYCHDDGTGNWTWRPLVPQEQTLGGTLLLHRSQPRFFPTPNGPRPKRHRLRLPGTVHRARRRRRAGVRLAPYPSCGRIPLDLRRLHQPRGHMFAHAGEGVYPTHELAVPRRRPPPRHPENAARPAPPARCAACRGGTSPVHRHRPHLAKPPPLRVQEWG